MFGYFGNMCTCIYCVFCLYGPLLLFSLCLFIPFFGCTSERTTATD